MAGTARTDIQFTKTPDAGPVHCSGWLFGRSQYGRPSRILQHIRYAFQLLLIATGKQRKVTTSLRKHVKAGTFLMSGFRKHDRVYVDKLQVQELETKNRA